MNDEAERRQAAIEEAKAEVERLTAETAAAEAETQTAFERYKAVSLALSKATFRHLRIADGGPIEDGD